MAESEIALEMADLAKAALADPELLVEALEEAVKSTEAPIPTGSTLRGLIDGAKESLAPIVISEKVDVMSEAIKEERDDAIINTAKKIIEHRHAKESSWLGEIFGTIYTTIWALAWYPQIRANYKEKSAIGYCYDLVVYNAYGFVLYSIYTVSQYQYQELNDLEKAVDWQDLFFAFHSLAVNAFYLCQAWYYDGRPFFVGVGWFCKLYIGLTIFGLLLHLLAFYAGLVPWVSAPGAMNHGVAEADWSVVEYLGIVKAVITMIKYPSQVVFNKDRMSCQGMSVFGFTMDMGGGAAALAQNVSDSVILNDMTFMTANIPKIIVAGSSVFWDMVIVYQGVWLYRNAKPLPVEERVSSRKPNSYTALILDFFAPAPWPPIGSETMEIEAVGGGVELGNYSDHKGPLTDCIGLGDESHRSRSLGEIKISLEMDMDDAVDIILT